MKKSIIVFLFLFALVPGLIFAGGQQEAATAPAEDDSAITVFTSILPQKYFVERIGGDRVSVNVLVGPGKSPATYEPSPQQVSELGSTEILFTIGVPFEKAFLPTISDTLKSLKIVDTSKGVEKRFLEAHSHDGEPGHEEGSVDPHIWLSPMQVKIQAKNIYDALVELDPEHQQAYSERYNEFIQDLDAIHNELATALEPIKGSTILVFHPAFGYFGDEFGLTQEAIETGGKEPAPSVLEEIIEHAKEDNAKVVFVQPEFSQESARSIAEAIGGTVVMLNPLNPDYLNNLRHIASEVKKAF